MLLLGFLTLSSQTLLIREIFSALYGSDVAIAFALAAWTCLTGLAGQSLERIWRRPLAAGLIRLGPVLYCATAVTALALSRHWAARSEVTHLHDYLWIPFWLGLPCVTGGALFTAGVRSLGTGGASLASAYAYEIFGGLWSGVCMTVYFLAGGTAVPGLAALGLAATVYAAATGRVRIGPGTTMVLGAVPLALAVVCPGSAALERSALRWRYPDCTILAHEDSPFGALTATRGGSGPVLYDNGVPLDDGAVLRNKRVIAAFLTQLPRSWGRVLAVQAVEHGMAPALAELADCQVQYWEPDPFKTRFIARWSPAAVAEASRRLWTGDTPWVYVTSGVDLICVFAASPGSLSQNQVLTAEFFARARRSLTPGGCLAVAIPTAPGFVHPGQAGCLASVLAAIREPFPHARLFRTDQGYAILVGSNTAVDAAARDARPALRQRLPDTIDPGVVDQVEAIFLDEALTVSLPGPRLERARPNRVATPTAFFLYTTFRARMIDGASDRWQRILRPQPWWGIGLAMLVLVLAPTSIERRYRGISDLFWSSWLTTMTLMFSLYLYQSTAGQAYGIVATLTAASMLGLFLGARRQAPPPHLLPPALLQCLLVVSLFPAYPLLCQAPGLLQVAALVGVNVATGLCLGWVFRSTARGNCDRACVVGDLFGVDLIGAAAGLLLGAVLLPWWTGFSGAAVWTAAAVVASRALGLWRNRCR